MLTAAPDGVAVAGRGAGPAAVRAREQSSGWGARPRARRGAAGARRSCPSKRNTNPGQSASAAAKQDVMKPNQLITLQGSGRIADERAFK